MQVHCKVGLRLQGAGSPDAVVAPYVTFSGRRRLRGVFLVHSEIWKAQIDTTFLTGRGTGRGHVVLAEGQKEHPQNG